MDVEKQELEAAILYSLFKYGEKAFIEIQKSVNFNIDFFSDFRTRRIYEIIEDVYKREKKVLSYNGAYKYMVNLPEVTSEEKLINKEIFKTIAKHQIKLDDILPFCQKIREYYIKRKLSKEMDTLITRFKEDNLSDSLSHLMLVTNKLNQLLNPIVEENVHRFKGDIEKRIQYTSDVLNTPEKVGVVITGYTNFDNRMPPIDKGSLCLFQSRTGKGKSISLMTTTVKNYLKHRKVIVITIEMNARQWALRIDSKITKVDHINFTKGTIAKGECNLKFWRDKVQSFGDKDNDIIFYWVPENCTPEVVDNIIGTNPFKPDLVVIDYAGDMVVKLPGLSVYDNKAQAEIYARLKALAGKHNCVIFSAQQIKRGVKKLYTTEDGSHTDTAASKSDYIITIEQRESDEVWVKKFEEVEDEDEIEDLFEEKNRTEIEVTGRLTVRLIKARFCGNLRTYIYPLFKRMTWFEEILDDSEVIESFKVEEKNKEGKEKINQNSDNKESTKETSQDTDILSQEVLP